MSDCEHDRLLNVPGSTLPQRLTPEREAELRHSLVGWTNDEKAALLRELDAVRAELEKYKQYESTFHQTLGERNRTIKELAREVEEAVARLDAVRVERDGALKLKEVYADQVEIMRNEREEWMRRALEARKEMTKCRRLW